jgi:hypothetical protein
MPHQQQNLRGFAASRLRGKSLCRSNALDLQRRAALAACRIGRRELDGFGETVVGSRCVFDTRLFAHACAGTSCDSTFCRCRRERGARTQHVGWWCARSGRVCSTVSVRLCLRRWQVRRRLQPALSERTGLCRGCAMCCGSAPRCSSRPARTHSSNGAGTRRGDCTRFSARICAAHYATERSAYARRLLLADGDRRRRTELQLSGRYP